MQPGRFYMHKNSMDICIDVLPYPSPLGATHVIGWWCNLGYVGEPFYHFVGKPPSAAMSNIKVGPEWVDITRRMHIKRTKPGLP